MITHVYFIRQMIYTGYVTLRHELSGGFAGQVSSPTSTLGLINNSGQFLLALIVRTEQYPEGHFFLYRVYDFLVLLFLKLYSVGILIVCDKVCNFKQRKR